MQTTNNTNDAVIKIFVSMHEESYVPKENKLLFPIQVGTSLNDIVFPDMLHDNDGDNISEKNKRYCELTAQYYAWKNVDDADYYGFFHYRRYLCFNKLMRPDKWGNVEVEKLDDRTMSDMMLDQDSMKAAISQYDIIVPCSWKCNEGDGPITVAEHWLKHFPSEDLKLLTNTIIEIKPEYQNSLFNVLYGYEAPFCNIFIMKKQYFDEYCDFCFQVLSEMEKRSDHSKYNVEQYRLLGHVAERLLAVYIDYISRKNKNIRILHLPIVKIQNTHPNAKILPLTTDKQAIPVVMACDDSFIPCLSVLVESISRNSRSTHLYDLVVLHRGIKNHNQNILHNQIRKKDNISLRFINVERDFEKYTGLFISRHLSLETYYRFLIPDLFEEYDKVIYLDCDTVVDTDIAELYFTDIGDNMIGAVRDYDFIAASRARDTNELYKNEILKYLPFDDPSLYFQAGVLVLALDKIRKKYSSSSLFEKALTREWYYHDQDVLNSCMNGSVYYLDARWNIYSLLEEDSKRRELIKNELPAKYVYEYEAGRKNIGIVHFAGSTKPWETKEVDLADYFWEYAKYSPFYELLYSKLYSEQYTCSGKIMFGCSNKFEDNKGVAFAEICVPDSVWREYIICVDFIYIPNQNNYKYATSRLYMDISSIPDDKTNKIVMKNFLFSKSDNDYYIKDNIGYQLTKNKTVILYARNVSQYEGYAWKVQFNLAAANEKVKINILANGWIHSAESLNGICFEKETMMNETDQFNKTGVLANSEVISQNDYLNYRITEIEKSFSYKLGMFLTYIPRKVRGVFKKNR